MMMQQLDAVLAIATIDDVVVCADPGNEVSAAGTAGRLVTEADDKLPVLSENLFVTVAG